ncbi:DMT family transporter [Albidovulum sediminicola]|uniref:DMT family transporter n=1 Tax=Albidovulum sediminicola TaxID=2984331 RepID=A0ABT2YZI3_9RHOB|nr:DMT family transporter [Defluviimonas sp. WL0075]MCV2864267.1 DMT family transporter [Defluviimonas sp. WL0075]
MRYGTGVVLVLTAGLLWSGFGLAVRHLDGAGAWAVVFWRSVALVPALMLFVSWRSKGQAMRRVLATGRSGAIGGLCLIAASLGGIYSIQATTVANAVFLFAAAPFLTAVLGWALLGERVRRSTWGAIALAAVGIYVMVREGLALGAMDGNLAALGSALGFAGFTIAIRSGRQGDMVPTVVLGGVFTMIAAALVAPMMGETLWVSTHDIVLSMGMGAGLLATGMALYTVGSRVIPAAELTLLSIVEVLMAPVWVWLFLGETASEGTILGGALLVGAVIWNAISGMRGRVPLTL